MACIDKIAADILNSCDTIPRSGFETIAWAINREDIDTVTHDATSDTLVTAITMNSGTYAYNVTAVKKEMNAGFDLVTGDDIPDTYKNFFSFKPYEKDAAAIANLDSMNDLVIIAELKGLKTEGCFVIYGLEQGLYKSSGTKRQNDSNGLPIYEMQSMEGQGERYSRFVFWDTDYATTKASIELLALIYGPELHTDANAASDPNGNEADATAGWLLFGLDVGSNVFESQSSVKNVGSYALHANSEDTPTAQSRAYYSFPAEIGATYKAEIDVRHIGSGGRWVFVTGTESDEILPEDVTFQTYTHTWTATGTTEYIFLREDSATNDGGVYADNLSIKKVL